MTTGSFFTIGSTHIVCEDYALHGENYVVLSDGCSNGGGNRIHTDWGSRLLCKAAIEHIDLITYDTLGFNNRCISTSLAQSRAIGMPYDCLTATLLAAVRKNNDVFVHMVGDGYFGAKLKNGEFVINEIEYETGAPYYLRYEINEADFDRYIEMFGKGKVTQTIYSGDLNDPTSMSKFVVDDSPLNSPFFMQFDTSEIEFVFIASDGLGSFYKSVIDGSTKHNVAIPSLEVCNILLDFKSFGGPFVERQGQWAFKTNRPGSFGKLNWHNGDDVSLGVIYCGE